MRLFAFILSLFILVLALIPCTDNETCNEPGIELSADHSQHEHDEDTCSPLCSCSCCGCGGYVISTPVFHVSSEEVKTHPLLSTSYSSDFISCYFYSFWQPPKLS